MNFLRKWKTRLFQRLLPITKNFSKAARSNTEEDRHPAKQPAPGDSPGKRFLRRHILLAGIYLFVVLALLSIFLGRRGHIPWPELPGFSGLEKEIGREFPAGEEVAGEGEGGSPVSPGEEATARSGEGAGSNPAGREQEQENENEIIFLPSPEEDEEAREGTATVPGEEEQEETGFIPGAGETILPQAAPPLPQWDLHSSFGDYLVEELPSGGELHRFSRGVLLRATPAAPVAVLWDGKVVDTGNGDSPFGLSLLLAHEGGYCTFYGNLREIWVKKGDNLNRGETIGLLPPASSSQGKKAALPAYTTQNDPFRLWPGTETAGAPRQEDFGAAGGLSPLSSDYFEEAPLLYLEVRFGTRYLDPLEFIAERN